MSELQFETYVPSSRRLLTDPDPQKTPELFTDADLLKEIKMLLRMNTRYGSHHLRTMAYIRLQTFINDRRTKGSPRATEIYRASREGN